MLELTIGQLRDAIVAIDADKAREVAQRGIDDGLDPLDIINEGVRSALDLMGERFALGDIFVPEIVLGAKAADAALEVLEPELLRRGSSTEKLGKVLMATVKGDIHDIGKNIVTLLMKAADLEVVDIGADKAGEEILAAAKEHKVDVIGLSALLTTTMPRMKEMLELLQESGVRDQYKVIVGGAPVTQEFADAVGADGYGADATSGVDVTKKLLGR
jgi:5-methyltetrahydrofolate--homocysteine methyltransferase